MKKNFKIIVMVVLILSMALALIGCGNAQSVPTPTPTVTETPDVSEYTITFDASGGTGSGPSKIVLAEGETVTIPENTYTKSRSTFENWWDGYKEVEAGAIYTMPDYDVTMSALWKTKSSGGGGGSSGGGSSGPSTMSTPVVTVKDGAITWNNVTGATSYEVSINGGTAVVATSPYTVTDSGIITVELQAKTTNSNYSDSAKSKAISVAKTLETTNTLTTNKLYILDYVSSASPITITSTLSEFSILKGSSNAQIVTTQTLKIDASTSTINQEVPLTAASIDLTVSGNSFNQKAQMTATTEAGIVITSGKLNYNNQINAKIIDIKANGILNRGIDNTNTASLPNLKLASGSVVDITLDKVKNQDVRLSATAVGSDITIKGAKIIIVDSASKVVNITTPDIDTTIINDSVNDITVNEIIILESKKSGKVGDDGALIPVTTIVVPSSITATDITAGTTAVITTPTGETGVTVDGNQITWTATVADNATAGVNKQVVFTNITANPAVVDAIIIMPEVYVDVNAVVTFDSLGSSAVSPITNTVVETAPTAPTKAGYTFDGWYEDYTAPTGTTEAVYTNKVNFPYYPTESVTLYAKWTMEEYTITYIHPYDVTVIMEGEEFFELIKNGTMEEVEAFVITKMRFGTSTEKYTVNTAVNLPLTKMVVEDKIKTIESVNDDYSAENFVGWYDEATGGNKVEKFEVGTTGDKTLYARWSEKAVSETYTVYFENLDAQDIVGAPSINPVEITREGDALYSDSMFIPKIYDPEPIAGKFFVGWVQLNPLVSTEYMHDLAWSNSYQSNALDPNKTITVKAVWSDKDEYANNIAKYTIPQPTSGGKVVAVNKGLLNKTDEKYYYAEFNSEDYATNVTLEIVPDADKKIKSVIYYAKNPEKDWSECSNYTQLAIRGYEIELEMLYSDKDYEYKLVVEFEAIGTPEPITDVKFYKNIEMTEELKANDVLSAGMGVIFDVGGVNISNIEYEVELETEKNGVLRLSKNMAEAYYINDPESGLASMNIEGMAILNYKFIIRGNDVYSSSAQEFESAVYTYGEIAYNDIKIIDKTNPDSPRYFNGYDEVWSETVFVNKGIRGAVIRFDNLGSPAAGLVYEWYSDEACTKKIATKAMTILTDTTIYGKLLIVEAEFEFKLKADDTYELVKMTNYAVDVEIPATYNSKAVTSIGIDAFSNSNLTSITIPNSITSIGESAFRNSNSLANIALPDSVTSIGAEAFGYTAYYENLANWELDGSLYINNHIIQGPNYDLKSYTVKEGTITIADNAFEYSFLETVTLPASLITIGNNAFLGNRLTEIILPENLITIGDFAFMGSSFDSIVIPDSVRNIGAAVIDGGMLTITIPKNVTHIESGAFANLNNLNTITVAVENQNYIAVDGVLFNKDKTELLQYPQAKETDTYTVPNTVIKIGNLAFFRSNIEVILTENVTTIGEHAFESSGITNITISSSVTTIGSDAFDYCGGLTSINIDTANANYSDVDGALFNKLKTELITYPMGKTVTSYVIPDQVTQIRNGAFSSNPNITTLTLSANLQEIEPRHIIGMGNLTTIAVPAGNPNFSSIDGILFNKDGTKLIAWPKAKVAVSGLYTIPDSVVEIGSNAFGDCLGITDIIIPIEVTTIGHRVFSKTNNEKLSIFIEAESIHVLPNWDEYWYDDREENITVYWGSEWTLVSGVPTPNIIPTP